jgi:hypothetical protein
VWHAQDARAYSLLLLLSALSLLLFARALDEPGTRRLAAWALVSVLALLTHYFAVFLVAGEALLLIAWHRRRRAALAASGAVALGGAALLPLALAQRAHEGAAWLATRGLGGRVEALWPHFAAGYGAAPAEISSFESAAPAGLVVWGTVLAGAAILLALAAVGVASVARSRAGATGGEGKRDSGTGSASEVERETTPPAEPERAETRGLVVALTLALATIGVPLLLAPIGVDYVFTRNLLPGWLVLALLAAIGIGARRTRWVGVPLGLALCGVLLAVTFSAMSAPRFGPDRWERVARALGDPGSARVVQVPSSIAMPLALERPGLKTLTAAGARVDEIVVLRRGDVMRRRAPAPGFELADRTVVSESFTVLRYRSRRPVRVTPRTILGDSELRRRRTAVLLAPAGAERAEPPTLTFCPRRGFELRRVAIRTPCAVAYPRQE